VLFRQSRSEYVSSSTIPQPCQPPLPFSKASSGPQLQTGPGHWTEVGAGGVESACYSDLLGGDFNVIDATRCPWNWKVVRSQSFNMKLYRLSNGSLGFING